MTSPICRKHQSLFSAYLDGAVSGKQMQQIAQHLETCTGCAREFDSLRAMQRTLAALGPAKAQKIWASSSGSPSRTNRREENQTGSTP